jgi:hypothetical protein
VTKGHVEFGAPDAGVALGANMATANASVGLANTLVAGSSSNNCYGSVIDLGGNMSSDGSCNFTATSSRNNLDPMLGPLADNGGPTPTMALLPGSPAIDFGVAQYCAATDQRGEPRPMGAGCDSGAYEVWVSNPLRDLTITMPEPGSILIHVNGPSGSRHILERATGASSWVPVWTNSSLPFDYLESVPASTGAWWYRSRAEP